MCEKTAPSFVFYLAPIGAFFYIFWTLQSYFWGWGQVTKTFLGLTYVDNQLWFFKYSSTCLFLVQQHFGPLLHFFLALWGYPFGPFGLIFGSG